MRCRSEEASSAGARPAMIVSLYLDLVCVLDVLGGCLQDVFWTFGMFIFAVCFWDIFVVCFVYFLDVFVVSSYTFLMFLWYFRKIYGGQLF